MPSFPPPPIFRLSVIIHPKFHNEVSISLSFRPNQQTESKSSNSKAASLAARLVENNQPGRLRHRDEEDDDDEALFAELEEEIENDTNASVREHGLQVLKTE